MCLTACAGFDFAFMSGFCTAGARLGAPDTGLISYGEMVDQVGAHNQAAVMRTKFGAGHRYAQGSPPF